MIKYIAPKLLFMLLFSVSLFTLLAQQKNKFTNHTLAGFFLDKGIYMVRDYSRLKNSTFSMLLTLPEYIILPVFKMLQGHSFPYTQGIARQEELIPISSPA